MSSLPVELLELVIDHLAEDTLVDLQSCARVCRSWHRPAIARFYRDIEVNATDWSWSSARCQPPVISAEAFRYLLDSGSPMVGGIRALELQLSEEFNTTLTDMAFPPDHGVTSLRLRGLNGWLPADEKLRLGTNFADITSLSLRSVIIESTSVFATAIAGFPLLRRLSFDGQILDTSCSSDIDPPSFAQPCDLILSGPGQPATSTEILGWAVLDPSRFNRISLPFGESYMFLTATLPGHPELGPLLHDIEVTYMGAAEDQWHQLDVGLAMLPHLSVLRLEASSYGCTEEAAERVLVKLVDTARRQAWISSQLRALCVRVVEFDSMEDHSYGRKRLERLALDLVQFSPKLRVDIKFKWVLPASSHWQSVNTFYESFAAWCMQRFPAVKWMAQGSLAVSTDDHVREL